MLAATMIIMIVGAIRIAKATNGLRTTNTRVEPVVVH